MKLLFYWFSDELEIVSILGRPRALLEIGGKISEAASSFDFSGGIFARTGYNISHLDIHRIQD
jgi:hypothetical protein